jgi:hypothetical protein
LELGKGEERKRRKGEERGRKRGISIHQNYLYQ